MSILRYFSSLIPVITFSTNLATLVILALGGYFVSQGSMSLGDFTAFNSYLAILIFPILIIGFMSNVIAQATASYGRIEEVFNAQSNAKGGTLEATLRGDIEAKDVTMTYGEKSVLDHASFKVAAGTRHRHYRAHGRGQDAAAVPADRPLGAHLGHRRVRRPPHRGVRQGELPPSGRVRLPGQRAVQPVLCARTSPSATRSMIRASSSPYRTAELGDFIAALPEGLDTVVSERGTSLSGGQKQRIMLARALALNPKVLLLDDFTARVDTDTEQKILANVAKNYPGLTLVSVTQKIQSVERYDQIILLMEGEILARGTHEELLRTSPEYVQIYESQKSTNQYELQA